MTSLLFIFKVEKIKIVFCPNDKDCGNKCY